LSNADGSCASSASILRQDACALVIGSHGGFRKLSGERCPGSFIPDMVFLRSAVSLLSPTSDRSRRVTVKHQVIAV
jgi:hypothetical protein